MFVVRILSLLYFLILPSTSKGCPIYMYFSFIYTLLFVGPRPQAASYGSFHHKLPFSVPFTIACHFRDPCLTVPTTCLFKQEYNISYRPEHSAVDALIKSFGPVTDTLGPKNGRISRFIPRPSMAAHDIKGAFNNTPPEALIQIMTTRRMPKYLINWVIAFTTNRVLAFSFDGNQESGKPFTGAIPQGSPVSPIIFSIVMFAIANMLNHFSVRARQKKSEMDMYLDINGRSVIVESMPQISLLGVTIDQTLSFMTHAQNATSKGAQALGSLLYLRKGVNVIKPVIARHLAMSVIFPKMFWASPF
jgi:hypothetical protein